MYINTFKYQPSDVSCHLCTEYVKKQGCTASRCPWLKERIEAGVVGYREAVFETMPRDRALHPRLCMLVKSHPGTLWSNIQHEKRMDNVKTTQGYRRRIPRWQAGRNGLLQYAERNFGHSYERFHCRRRQELLISLIISRERRMLEWTV